MDINIEELNNVLDEAVKISSNRSLESLLDLYNQLGVIIRQYSRTIHRMNLPKVNKLSLIRQVSNYLFHLIRNCYGKYSDIKEVIL